MPGAVLHFHFHALLRVDDDTQCWIPVLSLRRLEHIPNYLASVVTWDTRAAPSAIPPVVGTEITSA